MLLKKFLILVGLCFLFPIIGSASELSDADRDRFIQTDKKQIERALTKFRRQAYKVCKTKLKINLDQSQMDTLTKLEQHNRYERIKKTIVGFVDDFFTACKDSSFRDELVTKKNINLTVDLTKNVWKIKVRGKNVNIRVPNTAAKKDMVSMLKKKIK